MENIYNYYNLEDYLRKNLIDPNEDYLRWEIGRASCRERV